MVCCFIAGLIREYHLALNEKYLLFFAEIRLAKAGFDTSVVPFKIALAFIGVVALVSTIVIANSFMRRRWTVFAWFFLVVFAVMMVLAPAITYLAAIGLIIILLIFRLL